MQWNTLRGMWTTLNLGAKNLLLHKLRSALTVLGVVLGSGSVIAMLAIGEGSKREALARIRQLGAENLIIRSVKPGQTGEDAHSGSGQTGQRISRVLEYGLRHKDYDLLLATIPTLRLSVPTALVRRDAHHRARRMSNARLLATTPDYLIIKNLKLRRGRFLTAADLESTRNVAILGAGAAKRLFSFEDPLEKTLLLGEDVYRVVGTLAAQAAASTVPGAMGEHDFNDDIYIPLSAARRRFGELQRIRTTGSSDFERTQLHEIVLQVNDTSLVQQTATMARRLLNRQHPGANDFQVEVPLELLRQAEQEKRLWNWVLGSIAGISLLVGGIGIMNIMLATVTERTREIGIRRALGAKRRDITWQFMAETVILSSTGGLLGILFGTAIPVAVSHVSEIETAVTVWSVLLAFSVSLGTGVVFGIYPARRAALMDPIEALRRL